MDRPFPSLSYLTWHSVGDPQREKWQIEVSFCIYLILSRSEWSGNKRVHLFRKRDSGSWCLDHLLVPRYHVHALLCYLCRSKKSSGESLDYVADWIVLSLFLPHQSGVWVSATVSKEQGPDESCRMSQSRWNSPPLVCSFK